MSKSQTTKTKNVQIVDEDNQEQITQEQNIQTTSFGGEDFGAPQNTEWGEEENENTERRKGDIKDEIIEENSYSRLNIADTSSHQILSSPWSPYKYSGVGAGKPTTGSKPTITSSSSSKPITSSSGGKPNRSQRNPSRSTI